MGKKIAIIGAGNLGQAMAAHMALCGHEVSIYNRTKARIDEINERGGILIEGVVEGFAKMKLASPNIGDVIPGRDMVMVTVPASSHAKIAEIGAEYFEDGQVIVLHPGHTFGAIEFFNVLEKKGVKKELTYSEIQTSLITSRLTGKARVCASGIKTRLPISVFPADHGFDKIEVLFEIYPSSIRAKDVLKTGMDNLNASVHPAVTLLNLGQIDRAEEFLYYWDGFTPAVSKMVEAVDQERVELALALKVDPITIRGFFETAYSTTGDELWQKVQSNEAYRNITAPKKVNTRLITEDLPTGLVPYSSLGKELGIKTPTIDAFIEIANAIFDTDFRVGGRTMESMGLSGLGVDGIREFVKTGKR